MATMYFIGSGSGSGLRWNRDQNWSSSSGGSADTTYPVAGDTAIFDGNSNNCTPTADAACANLTVAATYASTLNFAGYNVAISNDCTLARTTSGHITWGAGTFTIGGNFDASGYTSALGGYWTRGGCTHIFTGASKTITTSNGASNQLDHVTISGTIALAAAGTLYCIAGDLTVDAGDTFTLNSNLYIWKNAVISGTITDGTAASIYWDPDAASLSFTVPGSGALTNSSMQINVAVDSLVLGASSGYNFTTVLTILNEGATNRTLTLSSGTYGFDDITIKTQTGGGDLTIACTNNPSIAFIGNVTLQEAGGGLVNWTAGTGTITFSGTNTQSIDFNGESVDDVVVNKTGGSVTLTGSFGCESFIGTDGDFDLDGFTITSQGAVDINGGTGVFRFWNGTDDSMINVATHGKFLVGQGGSGNLTLDGDSGAQLGIHDLDFDYDSTSTGTATYCDVQDSLGPPGLAGSGSAIDATAVTNTEIGGTNTGWNFEAAVAEEITLTDTLGVSDDYERIIAVLRDRTDTVGVSDDYERIAAALRDFTDTVGASDDYERIAAALRDLTDTVGVSEDVDRTAAWLRDLSDTVAVAEDVNASKFVAAASYDISVSDTIGGSDDVTVDTGERYWVGTDTSWNTAANWSRASGGAGGFSVPDSDKDVYFDTGSQACTLDVAAQTIASLTLTAGYSGTLAFDVYDIAITGDFTWTGSSNVDYGSGSHTLSGNFNTINATGSLTFAGSTWTFAGTTKTIQTTVTANSFDTWTITGSYEITDQDGDNIDTFVLLDIQGTLTISDRYLRCYGALDVSGTVDGPTGGIYFRGGVGENITNTGAISCGYIYYGAPGTMGLIGPGTYALSSAFYFYAYATAVTAGFNTGTIIFDCPVVFQVDSTGDMILDNSGTNPNIEFRGNVVSAFSSSGVLDWTAGGGTISFTGSSDQSIDFANESIESVEVDKTAGRATLAANLTCESFIGTSGDFDLDSYTVTSQGSVYIDASSGFRFWNGVDDSMADGKFDVQGGDLLLGTIAGGALGIHDLDFDLALGVLGRARHCNVVDSICTYTTAEINATARSNLDNGGNTGWNFVLETSELFMFAPFGVRPVGTPVAYRVMFGV